MRPTTLDTPAHHEPDHENDPNLDHDPHHEHDPSLDLDHEAEDAADEAPEGRVRLLHRVRPTIVGAAVAACVGGTALVLSATGSTAAPASDPDQLLAATSPADVDALTQRAAESRRETARASRSAARMVPATLAAPELTVTGKRWTTTALKVRTAPDEDAKVVGVLDAGDKVRITDMKLDGWRQISYEDEARWVKSSYLSKDKPKPAVSSATCPDGSRVESGLAGSTVRVHRAVCHAFPSVSAYGGVRGSGGNHGTGHALDIMVSGDTGYDIANYVRAHARELGVTEVIWHQRIWTTQRAGDGWRPMSDRGSATDNHLDHVHVSTR